MSSVLVAYFSASGRTRELAQNLARSIGAKLHEIVPKELYSNADLNWMDINSRSSIEMRDETARPQIANVIQDMFLYDVVYVGFPIWWYVAPRIVNTFLETYDMSGKIIVPFATSGGSGMGDTNAKLAASCKNAILVEGKVFKPSTDENILREWTKEIIDKETSNI